MSRVQAEYDLKQRLQQAIDQHTAYPVLYELDNQGTVDQTTIEKPYLKIEMKFLAGAEQKDLGQKNVTVEQWGQLQFAAVVPDGEGTRDAAHLLDYLVRFFDLQKIGTVQCKAMSILGGKPVDGMWYERAVIPFYYHRRT